MGEQEAPALPGEVWRGQRLRGPLALVESVGDLLVVRHDVERGAWVLASGEDVPFALRAALVAERAAREKAEALAKAFLDAARGMCAWEWQHVEDCPHRYCAQSDCDGSEEFDDCEADGKTCDCPVVHVERLRKALRTAGVEP